MIKISNVSHSSDIKKVVLLAELIWKEYYTPIIGRLQVQYMLKKFQNYSSIKSQIKDANEYFLLSSSNMHIGYFAIKQYQRKLFLSKLYIHPQYRNKGYASQIFKFLEYVAIKRNIKEISLTVNINNIPAQNIYEKHGFIYDEPLITNIGHNFIMDDYKMKKKISRIINHEKKYHNFRSSTKNASSNYK